MSNSWKRVDLTHDLCPKIFRKNWMFRLVGSECFKIGKRVAEISIASNGMTFEYMLTIDGKSLKKFVEAQAKNTRVWLPQFDQGNPHRVVLGKKLFLISQLFTAYH